MMNANYDEAVAVLNRGINDMILEILLGGGDFRYTIDSSKVDRTQIKSINALVDMMEDEVLDAMRTVEYRKWCRLQQICNDPVKYAADEDEKGELTALAVKEGYEYGSQVFEIREPIAKYLEIVDALHPDDSDNIWNDMDDVLLKVFELLGEPSELIESE